MNHFIKIITVLFFTADAFAQSAATISVDNNPYANMTGSGYALSNLPVSSVETTEPNCVEASTTPLPGEFVRDFKSFFGPQTSNSLCLLQEGEFQKTVQTKGALLKQSKAFKDSVADADVLIVGEMHLFTDLNARQDMISFFKEIKGLESCVAFEMPKRNESYTAFLDELKNEAQSYRKNVPEGQEWLADQKDDFIKYYDPMNTFAISEGMKTFGVDHEDTFKSEKELTLAERNQSMANNIKSLIDEKKCKAVLFFVGKAHETKNALPGEQAVSTLLNTKSLKTASVNIQMTYQKASPFQMWTWDVCQPPTLEQALMVQKENLPSDILLAPKSGERVQLKDYDFTFFLPQSQKNFPCASCVGEEWGKKPLSYP